MTNRDEEDTDAVLLKRDVLIAKNPNLCIKLRASEELEYRLLVNMHVLCEASSVLSRIFAKESKFKERQIVENSPQGQIPAIRFYDDCPWSLLLVLNVLHGKPVQKEITYLDLLQVAITANKYDFQDALEGWTNLWASRIQFDDNPILAGEEGWLFIFSIFELDGKAKDRYKRLLAKRASLDEYGELVFYCDWIEKSRDPVTGEVSTAARKLSMFPDAMSFRLIEEFQSLRLSLISPLRDLVEGLQQRYVVGRNTCRRSDNQHSCNGFQSRELKITTQRLGLGTDEFWNKSFEDVNQTLQSLTPRDYPLTGGKHPGGCSWVPDVIALSKFIDEYNGQRYFVFEQIAEVKSFLESGGTVRECRKFILLSHDT